MIEVIGKNGTAKIMTDMKDELAISHLYRIMSAGVTENSIVRVMADYHEGKGTVIGFTQKLDKNDPRVCPNFVGVDIGCRVSTIKLSSIHDLDFEKIDKWIRNNIPLGAGGYLKDGFPNNMKDFIEKEELKLFEDATKLIDEDGKENYSMKVSVLNQLISIGSGNHYIEIDQDNSGSYWLNIHCGSRNFGLIVANIYQNKAIELCEDKCEKEMRYLTKDSIYLDRYLTCVDACQKFSEVNHRLLLRKIGEFLCENFSDKKKFEFESYITTLHNYIDIENMIVRKGSISANENELVLIPFNMRDGIAIGLGQGNQEYNCSAPHGCGRLMSRAKAKQSLDLSKAKSDMQNAGVFTTSLDYALDEAADAYKNKDEIIEYIKPTVKILDIIKPVYNVKGK